MHKNHLLILIHGFFASPKIFTNLKNYIDVNNKSIITYITKSNSHNAGTTAGIIDSTDRITDEVKNIISNNDNIKYISILGHSLGGIHARCFAKSILPTLRSNNIVPLNVITVATPHLGIRRNTQKTLFNKLFCYVAPKLCKTSQELILEDNDIPLLYKITDIDHINALNCYKNKILYANIFYDWKCPYSTSSCRANNPYRNLNNIIHSNEYHNISKISFDNPKKIIKDDYDNIYNNDPKKDILRKILKNLQKIEWERYDIISKGIFCHCEIIGGADSINFNGYNNEYDDVIKHIYSKII